MWTSVMCLSETQWYDGWVVQCDLLRQQRHILAEVQPPHDLTWRVLDLWDPIGKHRGERHDADGGSIELELDESLQASPDRPSGVSPIQAPWPDRPSSASSDSPPPPAQSQPQQNDDHSDDEGHHRMSDVRSDHEVEDPHDATRKVTPEVPSPPRDDPAAKRKLQELYEVKTVNVVPEELLNTVRETEEESLKHCTFKPNINKQESTGGEGPGVFERLGVEDTTRRREYQTQLKHEASKKEMEDVTFTPHLSGQDHPPPKSNAAAVARLVEDVDERKQRREALEQQLARERTGDRPTPQPLNKAATGRLITRMWESAREREQRYKRYDEDRKKPMYDRPNNGGKKPSVQAITKRLYRDENRRAAIAELRRKQEENFITAHPFQPSITERAKQAPRHRDRSSPHRDRSSPHRDRLSPHRDRLSPPTSARRREEMISVDGDHSPRSPSLEREHGYAAELSVLRNQCNMYTSTIAHLHTEFDKMHGVLRRIRAERDWEREHWRGEIRQLQATTDDEYPPRNNHHHHHHHDTYRDRDVYTHYDSPRDHHDSLHSLDSLYDAPPHHHTHHPHHHPHPHPHPYSQHHPEPSLERQTNRRRSQTHQTSTRRRPTQTPSLQRAMERAEKWSTPPTSARSRSSGSAHSRASQPSTRSTRPVPRPAGPDPREERHSVPPDWMRFTSSRRGASPRYQFFHGAPPLDRMERVSDYPQVHHASDPYSRRPHSARLPPRDAENGWGSPTRDTARHGGDRQHHPHQSTPRSQHTSNGWGGSSNRRSRSTGDVHNYPPLPSKKAHHSPATRRKSSTSARRSVSAGARYPLPSDVESLDSEPARVARMIDSNVQRRVNSRPPDHGRSHRRRYS